MKADSRNWIVMGPPASDSERRALEAVRAVLPDDGRTTAWVNLTFIDMNGQTAEVDVLLLTPVGLFCVELKGWHGTITGNSQRWYQQGKTHPNPFLLTDRKGKRLASLLKSLAPSAQMERNVPWVTPLVVLHGDGSHFDVDQSGRVGVVKLDGYKVTAKPPLQLLSEFLATPPANPRDAIDPQRAQRVRRLCKKANFRATPKTRMVGDYAVEESDPLAEGVDWQDVVVTHPNLPEIRQRLRLYNVPPKAGATERQRIEQLAKREFQLTLGIHHAGIATPLQFLVTDDGPALVFQYQDGERPLDAFLVDEAATLTPDARVALVDQLGDILRYAQQRHLFHRALSPQHVWVRQTGEGPRLEVRDWYSAQKDRESATTTRWTIISRGATDLVGLAVAQDLVWIAPEARHSVADVPSAPLDVFGFGALAFLILTGRPPATTIAEVEQIQEQTGHFDPRAVTSTIPDPLAEAIAELTAVDETRRPETIDGAIARIDEAWKEIRRPDDPTARVTVEDPIDAQPEDIIGDRFLVSGRRGEGSSGVALAVLDAAIEGDKEFILKIARDNAAGRRLDIEAQVLSSLDHPHIVRLVESLELGGRRVLLMSDAGKETLAARIAKEGRSTLEQLQRWGSELLEAVAYLVEDQGVFHRDIKPANLGIAPDPGSRKPSLTLFDFSLAREPLENISAGTPGYLDPYLGKDRRIRYDRAAELWAVSVTLFEMATGVPPWWPSGAAPATPAEPPVVEPTSFDPAVAAPLTELFRRALAPDAKDRFSSAEDLLRAWSEVFASLALDEDARKKDDEAAANATLETTLEESGLSAQALSALRRLDGVVTVGDLLGVHPVKINGIRGLGETFRKEIQSRIAQWRTRLRPAEPAPGTEPRLGADRVVDNLVAAVRAEDEPLIRALLGLPDGEGHWPTAAEVAESCDTTRERVLAAVDAAVEEWSKSKPFLNARSQLTSIVDNAARVMTVPEAATVLVTRLGSTLDGPARITYGTALVHAIVEFDAHDPDPELALRRRAGAKADLIALTELVRGEDEVEPTPSADLLTDLAGELGAAADGLVADGLVPANRGVGELRAIVHQLDSTGLWHVSDARLLRLAAAASQTAAVSGFQELYPRTLPIKTALEHAMRGKPGRSISQAAIRKTVSARFPRLAEPLPASSDQLDALVCELYPDLERQGEVFVPKSTVLASSGSVTTTQFAPTPTAEISRQLTDSLARNSALTLTVVPKRYAAATRALQSEFDVDVLDVAQLVVTATKERIEAAGGQWSGLLEYDAQARDSRQWKALEGVVQQCVEPLWSTRLASTRPLLITNAGPLVRYGMAPLLASLMDTGTRRPAARWLLVAKAGDASSPLLEGQSVPLGPSGWIELPRDLALLADEKAPPPPNAPTGGRS